MSDFKHPDLLTDVRTSDIGDLIVSTIGSGQGLQQMIDGISQYSDKILVSNWQYSETELVLKEKPDIIVYCCRLADAFEDFEKIKLLRERLEHIPILGLSTHTDTDYKIEFLRSGITAFWENKDSVEGLYFQLRALNQIGASGRLLEVENRLLKDQLLFVKVSQ